MAVDFDAQIRAQSTLFRDAAAAADPAARVPTCPDWNATELLGHLAGVHWWWATIIEHRITDPGALQDDDPSAPSDHQELLRYFDEQTARLSKLLDATPDDVGVWTWSRDHTVGFIRRRMAHEALIHRIDAELAAGSAVSPVDAALATDGVAEMIEYFFCGPAWSTFAPDGPVGQLRTADTGARWLLRLGSVSGTSPDGARSYDREPAFRVVEDGTASFTVAAPARDLDAWLWQRPTDTEVVVEGSDADFATFTATVTA